MSYVLESQQEFERLEKQSETPGYDFREELAPWVRSLKTSPPRRVLDAGCGSGIVTRYLAETFPSAEVRGCDGAAERVKQAASAASAHRNVGIDHEDLTALSYGDGHFDAIVCRFVLQHMTPKIRDQALSELYRVLAPGGTLRIVDIDGAFFNFHPLKPAFEKKIRKVFDNGQVDMHVGRKLPSLLFKANFSSVDWDIQVLNFRGELLKTEIRLNSERFEQILPFISKALGSRAQAVRFRNDFLKAMSAEGSVFFYNKFLVTAFKPKSTHRSVRLLKA